MEYLNLKNQIMEKLSERVEFNDSQNLVELGLSSLQIMRLVNDWRKQGIRIQFGSVMENPTLENWWKLIVDGKGKRKVQKGHHLAFQKQFALTDVQYAYKIGRADNQELGGIGCHAYQEFDGTGVSPEKLEKAWNILQYHHSMLRARFLDNGLQEIMEKPYKEKIDVYDLRNEQHVHKKLMQIRERLSHRKLKVEEGQVAGIALSLLPEGKTRIHFDVDLLVSDVQSIQIILRDLVTAYAGERLPQESKEWNFAKYLEALKNEDQDEKEKAKEYWESRLEEIPIGPELPLAKQPSEVKNTYFNRRIIHLNQDEWCALQDNAKKNHATPAMLLLTAYALVLGRWSSRKKFLINIPYFNRKTEYKGLEDVVADFTTLLLLEVDLRNSQNFLEALNQIQHQVHRDMKHTMYSGVQVQRDYMKLHGDRQNIAPVVFACNLGTPLVNEEFTRSLGEFSYMISQTPGVWMDFQTYESDKGLMLTWDTVDELFPEGMIDDMISGLEICLRQLIDGDWNRSIDVLPEKQKNFIQKQKMFSLPDYSGCLHEMFLKNAASAPDRIAIIDTGRNYTLTYGELRKKALSCAAFLVKNNIQHQPVAITISRGYKQIVAALGIILSGNFYVPVSLNQPYERRKLIHEKTGIYYVITDDDNVDNIIWPVNTMVWSLETSLQERPLETPVDIKPDDPAYIIMTSGTTGLPKGVEICHKGALNTIADVNKRFDIHADDAVLGVSAMDFDLSVYDCFGLLSCGGKVVLIPEEKNKDAEFWMEQINKYNITIWNSVPVLLDMLLIQAEAQNVILPLQKVMLSGDWIGLGLPARVEARTHKCKFIAMGGATEASIWSNFIEVNLPLPKNWHSIPYGRPLAYQTYRIVDVMGMDTPFYSEGELWIGGVGVGTYRGDNELVKKKFVVDQYGKWYRTGDKGCFWLDGTIEFFGREDFQVKIRGHRIELGEIEAALRKIPGVHNAVVEASDGKTGDKHLIAYLEARNRKVEPLFEKNPNILKEADAYWKQMELMDDFCETKDGFRSIIDFANQKSCEVMLETLLRIGLFKDSQPYSIEELFERGRIVDTQKNTVMKWLEVLASQGSLQLIDGRYCLANKGDVQNKFMVSNADKIETYIERLKPYLPDLLQGEKSPLEVYYTSGEELAPNSLLEQLPGMEDTNACIISQLKKMKANSDGILRILEVGTRNIKITKTILEAFKSENVEYVYSDSSLYFIDEAKKLMKEFPFMKCHMLNIEEKCFVPEEKYDCVIMLNSLHRMKNLQAAFSNIQNFLKPIGIMVILEMTLRTYLQDITALVLENDAGKKDELLLRDKQQWIQVLQEEGFKRIYCYPHNELFYGRNIFVCMPVVESTILNEEYLNEALKDKLPEYMIPKVYNLLGKIPLNKNGKIDRKALHKFETKAKKLVFKEKPETDTEKRLCNIWESTFQINQVGIQDNYYLLGGDSLIATQMLTKIRKEFDITFTIKDVLGRKTIKEQAKRIDDLLHEKQDERTKNPINISPDKENENAVFNLTEVQQAYWIGRSGLYHLGQVSTHCYFELDCEEIDILKLQDAWNKMVVHHGMMRAIIHSDGKQQILKEVPKYQIKSLHLEDVNEEDAQYALEDVRFEMSHQVITTDQWPLFDVRTTLLSAGKVRIHISFDNLIFDGWSMFHLLSEWADRYRKLNLKLPQIDISFRDYVMTIEKIKKTEIYEQDKKYWLDRVKGFLAAPELPLQKNENEIVNQRFCRRSEYLTCEEWQSLKESAKKQGLTPSVLLLTAYAETLRRWSVNSDFTLNLTRFNREPLHPQVNQLVGDFTTLTLLEIKNSKDDTFILRAKSVQKQLMEDLEHTHYSAVDLERELKKKTGNVKNSIMPIVFTSGLGVDQWNEGKWVGKLVYNVSQTPQVWLDHQVVESDGQLGLFWDSVDELFYPGMLDEMFYAYTRLLKQIASNPDSMFEKRHNLVEVHLSEKRRQANQTDKDENNQSLDGLFLNMSEKYPNKTAIVNGNVRITYRELKEYALCTTRQLYEWGINNEDLVAILMEKGWEQIAGVYGILFSGAAYLPLDIANPAERLKKILETSNARYILVKQGFYNENEWLHKYNCIVMENKRVNDSFLIADKKNDRLAYTIYTSGSTGVPKGVMISHKGAVNTILDINSRYNVTEKDSILALSSLHFDLSVYDIFGLLGVGGKLVIPESKKIKNPEYWHELINQEKITMWNTVPAFLEMLMSYKNERNKVNENYLRVVLLSGDWIPIALPGKVYQKFKNVIVVGLGGATEASIWSNAFEIPREIPKSWKSIPYGKPLANQKYYVLDDFMQNRPDWVPGLLYIGGTGIARGYLNDEHTTNRSFVYCQETGERLYCTGDMGRYWSDGNIEFLGRIDNQIKINGYRVELGEIESALLEIDFVCSACTVMIHNSIVAVITTDCKGEQVGNMVALVKEELNKKLPDYFMPKKIELWESLPFNDNNKIDRKKMKQILETSTIFEDETGEEPVGIYENCIANVFKEVLDITSVSRNDNFFEKGGDSLKAMVVVNELNKKEIFKTRISLTLLFAHSTLKALAEAADGNTDIQGDFSDMEEGTL